MSKQPLLIRKDTSVHEDIDPEERFIAQMQNSLASPGHRHFSFGRPPPPRADNDQAVSSLNLMAIGGDQGPAPMLSHREESVTPLYHLSSF